MDMDQTIARIARDRLGIASLEPQGRDSLDFKEVGVAVLKQALAEAFQAGQEAMVYDEPGPSGGVKSIDWQGRKLSLGDEFASLNLEIDTDPHDAERVTPIGSTWSVDAIYPAADPPYVRLNCPATGASINPDLNELAHEFERIADARPE